MNYRQLITYLEQHPRKYALLRYLDRILVSVFIVGAALIGFTWLQRITLATTLRYLVIPLVSLLLVSWVRKRLAARRPWEVYGGSFLVKAERQGSSCPSRHVFSATLIATLIVDAYHLLLWPSVIAVVLVALVRVLSAEHFIRDVVWGALLGFLSAMLTIFLQVFQ